MRLPAPWARAARRPSVQSAPCCAGRVVAPTMSSCPAPAQLHVAACAPGASSKQQKHTMLCTCWPSRCPGHQLLLSTCAAASGFLAPGLSWPVVLLHIPCACRPLLSRARTCARHESASPAICVAPCQRLPSHLHAPCQRLPSPWCVSCQVLPHPPAHWLRRLGTSTWRPGWSTAWPAVCMIEGRGSAMSCGYPHSLRLRCEAAAKRATGMRARVA
jgi:hypothetical protein